MLQMMGSINVSVQVVGLERLAIMRPASTTILVAPTVGALSRPVRTFDLSMMPALGGQSAIMPKNVASHNYTNVRDLWRSVTAGGWSLY
eukprot:COSAG02_NODE_3584_length_6524_cov_7.274934_5_plen_89_part_00